MPKGIYLHKKGYRRPPFTKEWKDKLSESGKKFFKDNPEKIMRGANRVWESRKKNNIKIPC